MKTSARPPPLIQIFCPFMIQCLPSGDSSALVRIDEASEPLEGSVNAKAAMVSPVASFGRYLAFWASVPAIMIPLNPIDFKKKMN